MQLTRFTDYTLRTLMYLGAHPGEFVPTALIGEAHDISIDHLTKTAKWLVQNGYVEARRGAHGGLRLARSPKSIRVGALIREAEPQVALLECFDDAINACRLSPACRLKRSMQRAQNAFFAELDAVTLADLVEDAPELLVLLGRGPRGSNR